MAEHQDRGAAGAASARDAPEDRAPRANLRSRAVGRGGGASGPMVARLARLLRERGLEPGPTFAAAGLELSELALPSSRVPYAAVDALVERCAEAVGAGGLGLAMATTRRDGDFDPAALLLVSSATLGEGFERAFAYQRLWGDGERFSLRRGGGRVTIGFRHPGESPLARAVLAECAFAEIALAVRTLGDEGARPLAVRFAHAPLADGPALADYFGVEPLHGAAANDLAFAPEVLALPVRLPRAAVAAALERHASGLLAALPASPRLRDRALELVRRRLGQGELGLASVAEGLRLSARSLQRRLRDEGTSFEALLDEARSESARELFARGLRPSEIAYRLGYADTGALARARARWAGRG